MKKGKLHTKEYCLIEKKNKGGKMFGYKKKSMEIQKMDADERIRRYDSELVNLRSIRQAEEKREMVRKENKKIKELKSQPRREYVGSIISKLKSSKSKKGSTNVLDDRDDVFGIRTKDKKNRKDNKEFKIDGNVF